MAREVDTYNSIYNSFEAQLCDSSMGLTLERERPTLEPTNSWLQSYQDIKSPASPASEALYTHYVNTSGQSVCSYLHLLSR